MLPNRLRIKAKVSYEIVTQDVIKDDPNCMGLCDPNTKHIYLKKGLSKTDIAKTLLHESFHAIFDENDIKISHENVYKIEEAVYRVLKLNGYLNVKK